MLDSLKHQISSLALDFIISGMIIRLENIKNKKINSLSKFSELESEYKQFNEILQTTKQNLIKDGKL